MKPGMNTAEFAWLARWTGRSWTERLMLALLCTAPLVWLLAGTASTWLFDVDEGAFSEATREMIVSGDWGHTTLQGVNRFDKPIGVYWLQAASVQIFGLHEWALRLPSVLACWLSALALGRFAWQLWGLPAGVMAVLIHSTSIGPWVMAHAATADAVLGMWLVLSALDLCRFLVHGQPAHLRRVALWTGLGMLTKGPVAILIPAATLLLWCLQQRSAKALLASLRDGPAWLIFLAVCLPWYSYALWRHGDEFIQGFFVRHNLSRFDGVKFGHRAADLADLTDMYKKTRAEGFGHEVQRRVMIGTYVLSAGFYDAYYNRARRVRALIKRDFDQVFEAGVDAILTPATPSSAFGLGEMAEADPIQMYLNDVFTVTVNLAGLPGIAVPTGLDAKGLPMGLQLIGRPWEEADLLNVAYSLERAAGFVAKPARWW